MIPWILIEKVSLPTPNPGQELELSLLQREREFSIQIGHLELMNSREHGSEDALAELALARMPLSERPQVLIGGLGLGFTLAAALRVGPPQTQIEVAELLPAVVRWNQGPLGHLADHPLRSPRASVIEADVSKLVKARQQAYDAILLDIDNGPSPITLYSNGWLYSPKGLLVLFAALKPGGILGIWSAGPEAGFSRALEKAGFIVEEKRVKSRGTKGSNHVIWLAQRPAKGQHKPRPQHKRSRPS